jgi:hypothetical protein
MAILLPRSFNCKDEELPVICKFTLFNLKRDLADFTAYSPMFNDEYVASLEYKIIEVSDLLEPKSETVQLKAITERLYGTMNALINPINRLTGYINLAHESLNVSPADFGLTLLRKGINSKDAESVIKNLHLVVSNINRNKEILTTQGLQDELIAVFTQSITSVSADKQTQYEIISNRKTLVQNNVGLLNGLFNQITEIMTIGKILYKDNNAAKLQEYTFSELKKRVRKTTNTENGKPESTENSTKAPEA